MESNYASVRAPELRGSAWLNIANPLHLADLRGKIVLLDFWTYGCINCIHVLEDLKYLEHKYADRPFVIIGVHSPKFANEDDPESLRQAIARYGITHPVLLDSGLRTWDAYAVHGWPTLALVDPNGYLLGEVAGEGHLDQIDAAIGRALDLLQESDIRNDAPLPLRLEAPFGAISAFSPLLYPGKVLADAASKTLYIADTGHHRIVSATFDGVSVTTIGSGNPGAQDGSFETATFHTPQGMALDRERNWLYVADTGNHLIRRIDLSSRSVTTVAGTGQQGFIRTGSGPARAMPLNSPWDLCLLGNLLYSAMAGLHQIWAYDPVRETVSVYAGSGAEGRADGSLQTAALAQPSGLATDGARLFVADSESSCLREITVGNVTPEALTLAGGDLFQFGLRDGVGDDARFQHPLGVTWVPATQRRDRRDTGSYLVVADTYNHALRRLDLATRKVNTLAGGAVGYVDGALEVTRFNEPGGVSYADGFLYIADTNNHAIRVYSVATDSTMTLSLPDLCAPGLCLPG